MGTWLSLASPFAARMMANAGFDWLTVDLEHTPASYETAALCFSAIAAGGSAPLARIPWNTGENIKRALDSGAWGVVVPMVNSRAEAELAVRATRYHPQGDRSIGGQLHAINFGTDAATYYARGNEELLLIVMIEHADGVERAEEILSVPGIDGVFIGPNDLSNSLGLKPEFDSADEKFVSAVNHIRETARKHGVPSGIHVADTAMAERRLKEGFQFIAVSSEAGMMLGKAREITKALQLGEGKQAARY
ncbi:MAG TPA: aldolase/citrate lyase family protein [Methylomirabilota bacterium]|nr:aldolase/citrate lyase family protein [Methylomirabilota bacterium]